MKNTLAGIIGALTGVFLCAVFGINFSKGVETKVEAPAATSAQSQSTENWPSRETLQDFAAQRQAQSLQLEVQRLRLDAFSCRSDLQIAKWDALRK